MASNLVVARGGVEFVPPISLAFWRWTLVFLILLPFTYVSLKKNFKIIKKEYKKLFFKLAYVNGSNIKKTNVHLQKANEIGGTNSTPPRATTKLLAIKIG